LRLFAVSAIGCIGVFAGYSHLAAAGSLGESAQLKYQAQSQGGNLLAAARPESVVSYYAIKANPLLGRGSDGQLDADERAHVFSTLARAGANTSLKEQDRLLGQGINSHSQAFSAWVHAGVLGFLPWLYMIYLGVRRLTRRSLPTALQPLLAMWVAQVIWDALFSPWTPHTHVVLGAFVALVTFAATDIKGGGETQAVLPATAKLGVGG
jgi:hypothetical protein